MFTLEAPESSSKVALSIRTWPGSEGAPIWDGFASLTIRPATREEAKDFEDAPTEEDG